MKMSQNRLKSPVVWLSFFVLFFNQFGLHEFIGLDVEGFHVVIEAITTILIAFGIINNPTDEKNF